MKKKYWELERNILILIAIPLPAFAFAYLYTTSGNMELPIPTFPLWLSMVLLVGIPLLLAFSYFKFNGGIKQLRNAEIPLEQKVQQYCKMTMSRFWQLFVACFLCAFGLIVYENPGFTVAYAVTLIMTSLAKPTPDRIIRLLRLKEEDRATIEGFKIREG
ncbi:hypothetical protein DN752_08340 [Echinicola strongylocentroti]|uniref:Uncharacterized protein n=1 Tax=Echinicola strongylocentroti TaxID=1795355 RepID=A0A2Z4IPL2_9BACT|nr:hypothetical protein [Echinicola strongylocentroti]AWW33101.1 hypothetical protein DN752_08340 [Echinicola strongylocentroti]